METCYRLKLISGIPTDSHKMLSVHKQCLLWFIDNPQNRTAMRIVAAEMYLSRVPRPTADLGLPSALSESRQSPRESRQSDHTTHEIMIHLETWAAQEDMDTELRAQAVDVLLNSPWYPKEKAQKLFEKIRQRGGKGFGIYEDSQNVHLTDIEDSVLALIKTLIKDTEEYPDSQHFSMWSRCFLNFIEKEAHSKPEASERERRLNRIRSALYRIEFSSREFCGKKTSHLFSMIVCLIEKKGAGNKTFLYERLEQEMNDLINTCATGIASRLINTLSSWRGYSLNISFKEQIKSCFAGRMNALIRELNTDGYSHQFFQMYMEKVLAIFTVEDGGPKVTPADGGGPKEEVPNKQFVEDLLCRQDIAPTVLREPSGTAGEKNGPKFTLEQKMEVCEEFAGCLLFQMDSKVDDRRCFRLFFSWAFSKISLELAEEFKSFTHVDQYQIALREAIDFYSR